MLHLLFFLHSEVILRIVLVYLLILLILVQLLLLLALQLPALVVVVLDAVETRREADPSFDVLEVVRVVLLEGGIFSGGLMVIAVNHVFEVHVGRPSLLFKIAGVVGKLGRVLSVLIEEVVAEILDADVLLVVLITHGLRHLDHLGEIEHPDVGFAAFLLN